MGALVLGHLPVGTCPLIGSAVSLRVGMEIWAAEIVLSLRKQFPVTLEAVLPCEEQDARWPLESPKRYQAIITQCDKVTLLQTRYTPVCFDRRNRYMVDHSDLIIAVWNGSPSGTGNTISYAKSLEKRIRVIPVYVCG